MVVPLFYINKLVDKLSESSTGCLEYQGSRFPTGYGRLYIGTDGYGKSKLGYTHRLIWEYHFGSIPKGLHVMHSCDNPCCCNIEHLSLGTPADNMRDRDRKGRGVVPVTPVDERVKNEIVERYKAGGITKVALSREYELSIMTVYRITKDVQSKYRTSDETKALIKTMYAGGMTQVSIAKELGLSETTVYRTIKGRR